MTRLYARLQDCASLSIVHVTSTGCVLLFVGDELCSPELDNFKLINFTFITEVPGQVYSSDGLTRDYRLVPIRRSN